jgi:hypothetical protein
MRRYQMIGGIRASLGDDALCRAIWRFLEQNHDGVGDVADIYSGNLLQTFFCQPIVQLAGVVSKE